MPRGVISAGYNLSSEGFRLAQCLGNYAELHPSAYHVIPSHPTAKNELKTKRKTAATIPVVVLVCEVAPASIAIDICSGISVVPL